LLDAAVAGTTLTLTVRALGWATLVGAAEQLLLRRRRLLPPGVAPWPLAVGQLAVGATCLGVGTPALAPLGLLLHLLMNGSYRGSFNGGSDTMTSQLWLGTGLLALADWWPTLRVELTLAGLSFIAVQSVASYTIAGFIKLKERGWRDGSALPSFLAHPRYRVPAWARRVVGPRAVTLGLSYGVLAFECTFPVALLDVRCALGFCAIAAAFHLANALLLGLNRFLWVWLATYPAIIALSAFAQQR
jgi:hypothetical protein